MREDDDLELNWSGRWNLAYRILAVNILTIVLLAAGILYLDAFRNRLSKERARQVRIEATVTAVALASVPEKAREATLAAITKSTDTRMRIYGEDGNLVADSWKVDRPHLRASRPHDAALEQGRRPSDRSRLQCPRGREVAR